MELFESVKTRRPRSGLKVVCTFTNPPKINLVQIWLKSKSPMSGGGGGWWNPLPTFDAEFKFAKIQNSHVWEGRGGVGGTNFQLLMLSSHLLKS